MHFLNSVGNLVLLSSLAVRVSGASQWPQGAQPQRPTITETKFKLDELLSKGCPCCHPCIGDTEIVLSISGAPKPVKLDRHFIHVQEELHEGCALVTHIWYGALDTIRYTYLRPEGKEAELAWKAKSNGLYKGKNPLYAGIYKGKDMYLRSVEIHTNPLVGEPLNCVYTRSFAGRRRDVGRWFLNKGNKPSPMEICQPNHLSVSYTTRTGIKCIASSEPKAPRGRVATFEEIWQTGSTIHTIRDTNRWMGKKYKKGDKAIILGTRPNGEDLVKPLFIKWISGNRKGIEEAKRTDPFRSEGGWAKDSNDSL